MWQQIFRIPTIFDSDDDRRRQITHLLLSAFVVLATLVLIVTFRAPFEPANLALIIAIALNGLLLFANRSSKMPGWLSAVLFVVFLTIYVTQLDMPHELSMGTGLILWALPMLIAALILRPSAAFAVAIFVSVWMLFSSVFYFDSHPFKFYALTAVFAMAWLCWLIVTMLNQAIHAARLQAANTEVILATIKDGVLVLDSQGNFVSANTALLKMIPADKLREINQHPLEETLQWKRTVFSVKVSLLPEGGSVLVFRDETRRHEADRAKDALLATASHELRTPLGSVMNYIELLLMLIDMGKVHTDKFKTYLNRAHQNSRRLLGLVNNILDQAQLQSDGGSLKRERCNLPALFERTPQHLAALMLEKKLSYDLSIAPNVPEEIISDAERLYQVLNNLIGNAVKFTNQGGIKVKVFVSGNDTLTIEVADTGPGIPEEQLPDIFEVFRRGSNYAQREHQGAGLGLSLVRELVSLMGGQVAATSTLGVGSVFTVSIPITLPDNEQPALFA